MNGCSSNSEHGSWICPKVSNLLIVESLPIEAGFKVRKLIKIVVITEVQPTLQVLQMCSFLRDVNL